MKRFLLAAAAVVIVAGPALAQPQPDQKTEHRSAAPAQPQRPNASAPQRGPGTPNVHAYGGQGNQRFAPRTPGNAGPGAPRPQGYVGAPRGYAPQNNAQQSGADRHMVGGQNRFGNQGQRGDLRTPGQRGDWRGQGQRGDWRGQGQRSQGWWRGQRGFESYAGRRDGYWFAPGYGYYRPDPRWYGFDWEIGASVPFELRSYYINDPYAYNLPPAPYGCAWIFLGNELVMIDMQTGQIVQIAGQY